MALEPKQPIPTETGWYWLTDGDWQWTQPWQPAFLDCDVSPPRLYMFCIELRVLDQPYHVQRWVRDESQAPHDWSDLDAPRGSWYGPIAWKRMEIPPVPRQEQANA